MENGDLNASLTEGAEITPFEEEAPAERRRRVPWRVLALSLVIAGSLGVASHLISAGNDTERAEPAESLSADVSGTRLEPDNRVNAQPAARADVGRTDPERLSCGSDASSASGKAAQVFRSSRAWTQAKSEVVRVKLWGGGGMGGAPVRMVPKENGCSSSALRRLRGRGGRGRGYTGLGTRADLRNNRANQMNPNNWRYWSSRGVQPPWERSGVSASGGGLVYGRHGGAVAPPWHLTYTTPAPYGSNAGPTTSSTTLPWVRGLPLAVARRFARWSRLAARKWLPREKTWMATDDQVGSVGPCGELWLCGAGGGGGGFTDQLVNLTAGRRYELQVGTGGFPGVPRGSATRLLEHTDAGPRVLAEASGGFGGTGMDEERLVTLGGAGGAGDLPGMDGEASRSDFQDLQTQRLVLTGADLQKARQLSPEDLERSFAAVRIPCAGAIRSGAVEREAGLIDFVNPGGFVNPGYHSFTSGLTPKNTSEHHAVSDHMLVCLPEPAKSGNAGAYGIDAKNWNAGDQVLLNPDDCAKIKRQFPDGLPKLIFSMSSFENHIVYGSIRFVDPISQYDENGRRDQNAVNKQSRYRSYLQGAMPREFHLTNDIDCFKQIWTPFNGSSCIGVACLRSRPDAACRALPSCLTGLRALLSPIDFFSLSRGGGTPGPLLVSSSGPKGGPTAAAAPDASPAGHGGDGSCPEISAADNPANNLQPLTGAPIRQAAPTTGEPGMGVMYSCA
ncbi:unnamed protein product [Effrenium voratum]|uniref:Uncharacterized protein n=1 Tax=Effrenium voratum TaxID=2562239 RepID=A0AA36IZQ1_9DINO|nr:unnamed protein product [Effrenium voratum]